MADSAILDVPVRTNQGQETTLRSYQGKALLIVNTASECGYTPQYAGLETLYQRYRDRGFEVLAFPSNDFGAQEPGSDADIRQFCEMRYRTTFPLFSKVAVKGAGKHPLYALLTETPGMTGEVKWNFGKFLVDRQGRVVARYESKVEPLSPELTGKLDTVLAAG